MKIRVLALILALMMLLLCFAGCSEGNDNKETEKSNGKTEESKNDETEESKNDETGESKKDEIDDKDAGTTDPSDGNGNETENKIQVDLQNVLKIIDTGLKEIESLIKDCEADTKTKEDLLGEINSVREEISEIANDNTFTDEEKVNALEMYLHSVEDGYEDNAASEGDAQEEIANALKNSDIILVNDLGIAFESNDKSKILEALGKIEGEVQTLTAEIENHIETMNSNLEKLSFCEDEINYYIVLLANGSSLTEQEKSDINTKLDELEIEYNLIELANELIEDKIKEAEEKIETMLLAIYEAAEKIPTNTYISQALGEYAGNLYENGIGKWCEELKQDIINAIKINDINKEIANIIDGIRCGICVSLTSKENNDILEELKDAIANSDANDQDREGAKDWLEKNYREIQADIIESGKMTEKEKSSALKEKYKDMVTQINQGIEIEEQYYHGNVVKEMNNSNGNHLFKFGEALDKNNVEYLYAIIDEMKDEISDAPMVSLSFVLEERIGEADAILDNGTIGDEIKTIFGKYKDELLVAQEEQKKGENYELSAKDSAISATEDLRKDLSSFMIKHFEGVRLGEEMRIILENAQKTMNSILEN